MADAKKDAVAELHDNVNVVIMLATFAASALSLAGLPPGHVACHLHEQLRLSGARHHHNHHPPNTTTTPQPRRRDATPPSSRRGAVTAAAAARRPRAVRRGARALRLTDM